MEAIPFINRQRIVKLSVVWVLGLTVLLGSAAIAMALVKFEPGKTYCYCSCRSGGGVKGLYWERVGACGGANGKNCSFKNPIGQTEQGKLDSCQKCDSNSIGGFSCVPEAMSQEFGGMSKGGDSRDPGTVRPPGQTAPVPKAGMNAPIMRRGVEPESSIPSPTEEGELITEPQ